MFLLRERLGRRAEHRDLGATFAASAASKPFMFGTSTGVHDARLAADARHHVGAVGHLRHPLRRHERRGLDRRQPRIAQAVDQADLDVGRDGALLVLQPVARADLDDA